MGYGGMSGAMAAKLGGPPKKKKPAFMDGVSGDVDGDQAVDATGADEVNDMDGDTSSTSVNSEPEVAAEAMTDENEGAELTSYDAVENDAADELAGLAGVSDENREAFKSALSDYVAACVKRNMSK